MREPDSVRTTRDSYDAVAGRYAECFSATLETEPLQRAMLDAFAALVRGGGPVADVGCGPGYVTGHLHRARGGRVRCRPVAGDDRAGPSGAPGAAVRGGDDGRAGGAGRRPRRCPLAILDHPHPARSGCRRSSPSSRGCSPRVVICCSVPAGHDEPAELAEAYDHLVALAYRWSPDRVADLLREHGLQEVARLVYAPELDVRRGFPAVDLLARSFLSRQTWAARWRRARAAGVSGSAVMRTHLLIVVRDREDVAVDAEPAGARGASRSSSGGRGRAPGRRPEL